jgi:hypothetical protein
MNAERGRGPALLTPPAPPGPALGVLSAVLERDGQQHSATQTRHQALADADHLALAPSISNAIPVSAAIPVGRSRAPGSARRAPVMALGIRGAIDRVPPPAGPIHPVWTSAPTPGTSGVVWSGCRVQPERAEG